MYNLLIFTVVAQITVRPAKSSSGSQVYLFSTYPLILLSDALRRSWQRWLVGAAVISSWSSLDCMPATTERQIERVLSLSLSKNAYDFVAMDLMAESRQ